MKRYFVIAVAVCIVIITFIYQSSDREEEIYGVKFEIPTEWSYGFSNDGFLHIGKTVECMDKENFDYDVYFSVVTEKDINNNNLDDVFGEEKYTVLNDVNVSDLKESEIMISGVKATKLDYIYNDEAADPERYKRRHIIKILFFADKDRLCILGVDPLTEDNEDLVDQFIESIEF